MIYQSRNHTSGNLWSPSIYLNNALLLKILYIHTCSFCRLFGELNVQKQNNITWMYSKFCHNNKWILILILIFMIQHQLTWNNITSNSYKFDKKKVSCVHKSNYHWKNYALWMDNIMLMFTWWYCKAFIKICTKNMCNNCIQLHAWLIDIVSMLAHHWQYVNFFSHAQYIAQIVRW